MEVETDLLVQLKDKIKEGEKLLENVAKIKNLAGVEKLKKKIKQEINFLFKVSKAGAKKEHLICTNLHHFEALVSCLLSSYDTVAVLQYFSLNKTDGSLKRICVDVVSERGQQWIKVIARNPKALSQLSVGEGEFGQRSIVDHALEYLECAHQHPYLFKTPKVVFQFACGIEKVLADRLSSLGVFVYGKKYQNCELSFQGVECNMDDDNYDEDEDSVINCDDYLVKFCEKNMQETNANDSKMIEDNVQKLNLDVTAMLSYISGLTNGRCYFEFKEPILTQQAQWEKARPVKPLLDKLFQGKSLFCCESALTDFNSIVSTLGGPGEVMRARELLSQITVIPDMISSCGIHLKLGGKIKKRSLAVFSTGNALRAITVTANEGFVRAAKNQGVEFAVFIHESRALTEGKEHDAKIIDPESTSSTIESNVSIHSFS